MTEHVTTAIGTELLYEDPRVRVWSMALDPGQASPLHRHLHDHLYVYVTPDNEMEVHTSAGDTIGGRYDDGWVSVRTIGDGTDPTLQHQLRNVGRTPHRQVLVEFLTPLERHDGPMASNDNQRGTEVRKARTS